MLCHDGICRLWRGCKGSHCVHRWGRPPDAFDHQSQRVHRRIRLGLCRPLILHQFVDVKTARYIKMTNEDYDKAVRILRGCVQYSDYWSAPHSFYDCVKLFGGIHPSIQGCLKSNVCEIKLTNLTQQLYRSDLHYTYLLEPFWSGVVRHWRNIRFGTKLGGILGTQ